MLKRISPTCQLLAKQQFQMCNANGREQDRWRTSGDDVLPDDQSQQNARYASQLPSNGHLIRNQRDRRWTRQTGRLNAQTATHSHTDTGTHLSASIGIKRSHFRCRCSARQTISICYFRYQWHRNTNTVRSTACRSPMKNGSTRDAVSSG